MRLLPGGLDLVEAKLGEVQMVGKNGSLLPAGTLRVPLGPQHLAPTIQSNFSLVARTRRTCKLVQEHLKLTHSPYREAVFLDAHWRKVNSIYQPTPQVYVPGIRDRRLGNLAVKMTQLDNRISEVMSAQHGQRMAMSTLESSLAATIATQVTEALAAQAVTVGKSFEQSTQAIMSATEGRLSSLESAVQALADHQTVKTKGSTSHTRRPAGYPGLLKLDTAGSLGKGSATDRTEGSGDGEEPRSETSATLRQDGGDIREFHWTCVVRLGDPYNQNSAVWQILSNPAWMGVTDPARLAVAAPPSRLRNSFGRVTELEPRREEDLSAYTVFPPVLTGPMRTSSEEQKEDVLEGLGRLLFEELQAEEQLEDMARRLNWVEGSNRVLRAVDCAIQEIRAGYARDIWDGRGVRWPHRPDDVDVAPLEEFLGPFWPAGLVPGDGGPQAAEGRHFIHRVLLGTMLATELDPVRRDAHVLIEQVCTRSTHPGLGDCYTFMSTEQVIGSLDALSKTTRYRRLFPLAKGLLRMLPTFAVSMPGPSAGGTRAPIFTGNGAQVGQGRTPHEKKMTVAELVKKFRPIQGVNSIDTLVSEIMRTIRENLGQIIVQMKMNL